MSCYVHNRYFFSQSILCPTLILCSSVSVADVSSFRDIFHCMFAITKVSHDQFFIACCLAAIMNSGICSSCQSFAPSSITAMNNYIAGRSCIANEPRNGPAPTAPSPTPPGTPTTPNPTKAPTSAPTFAPTPVPTNAPTPAPGTCLAQFEPCNIYWGNVDNLPCCDGMQCYYGWICF